MDQDSCKKKMGVVPQQRGGSPQARAGSKAGSVAKDRGDDVKFVRRGAGSNVVIMGA